MLAENGATPSYAVSRFDKNVNVFGEDYVHPRTESDEPEKFPAFDFVTRPLPAYHTSSNQPSYLSDYHLNAFTANSNDILLVHTRSLFIKGSQKLAMLVLETLQFASNRRPINVHIKYVQENADYLVTTRQPRDLDHLSVRRRDYQIFSTRNYPRWIAKEIAHKQGEQDEDESHIEKIKQCKHYCERHKRKDVLTRVTYHK